MHAKHQIYLSVISQAPHKLFEKSAYYATLFRRSSSPSKIDVRIVVSYREIMEESTGNLGRERLKILICGDNTGAYRKVHRISVLYSVWCISIKKVKGSIISPFI